MTGDVESARAEAERIAANNPDAAVHVTVRYDDGTLQRRR